MTDFEDQWARQWIGDKRVIRLVQKWLRAGVLEDGIVTIEEKGTGQGSVISPLLANVYLHYVFDLWAERWRRREATGLPYRWPRARATKRTNRVLRARCQFPGQNPPAIPPWVASLFHLPRVRKDYGSARRKTGSFVPGTDGSNPSPSTGESCPNGEAA